MPLGWGEKIESFLVILLDDDAQQVLNEFQLWSSGPRPDQTHFLVNIKHENHPSYLQLLFIKVAKPFQRNHLVEAVKKGFRLLLHPAGEPPVRQQAVGGEGGSFRSSTSALKVSWDRFCRLTWCTLPCFPPWPVRSRRRPSAGGWKLSRGSPCPERSTAPPHTPPGCSP